jgi:hypothetical protein
VHHDTAVRSGFLHPWQQTLSTSINVALKARQAVRVSRLELDAAKQSSVPLLASLSFSFFPLSARLTKQNDSAA